MSENNDDKGPNKGAVPPSPPAVPARPSEGGLRQMFARDPKAIRDVLPTEAEGDALLDMLFDDAPRRSSPTPEATPPPADEPTPIPVSSRVAAPVADPDDGDEEQPTRLHDADQMAVLLDSVRTPPVGGRPPPRPSAPGARPGPGAPQRPARPSAGEVVAPPGCGLSQNADNVSRFVGN